MPPAGPVAELAQPPEPLPEELAAIIRPELPTLVTEIAEEIRRVIPEYAQVLDGPREQLLQEGVELSLSAFVDRIEDPAVPTGARDDMCRRLGRYEAYEGREFQNLRSALRVGARVALRRAKRLAGRYHFSPTLVAMFADSVFAYIDSTESLCLEGYQEVVDGQAEGNDSRRGRLLRLLLAGTGNTVPHPAVVELAESAEWPLPESVTPVALGDGGPPDRAALGADVLAELDGDRPHLLVPGPLDGERLAALDRALGGRPAVAGLTVPLAEAADSLRWARQAQALAAEGVIEERPFIRCEEHLITLWLQTDPALTESLAHRLLGPLDAFTPNRRERLVDTLRVWMTTRGTADHMAGLLNVHPQTVRYRMRTLNRTFGPQLSDSGRRFAIEATLRSLYARKRGARRDAYEPDFADGA